MGASFRRARARARYPSPTLEFYDAGHALGSAGIMVRGERETLFYTGDVSFRDQTILKGARFEDVEADVLIMETTRGSRPVPEGFSREAEIHRLARAILHVLDRKGSVLIPVFALGRTQEILAMLALLMGSGELPRRPIYIGGLGRVFTEIYDLEAHRTHRQHSHLKLTEALDLIVLDKEQTDRMRLGGGRIFVVTAGMMNENTAAHNLALRLMADTVHAIFFVGYADPDTPGGRLESQPARTNRFSSARPQARSPALAKCRTSTSPPTPTATSSSSSSATSTLKSSSSVTANPRPGSGSPSKSASAIQKSASSSPSPAKRWNSERGLDPFQDAGLE